MEDLENTIGKILGDPDAMASILSIAQGLGLGSPQDKTPEEASTQNGPAHTQDSRDDSLNRTVASLLAEAGKLNGKHTALLKALRPFLREGRREKIDRAIQAARISHIAGYAIKNLGQTEQGR